MKMPKVRNCDVTQCCYNSDQKCRALAITVGDNTTPACDTFTTACEAKGGDMNAIAGVGACKVNSCQYNKDLECVAPSIAVGRGAQPADCLTFKSI